MCKGRCETSFVTKVAQLVTACAGGLATAAGVLDGIAAVEALIDGEGTQLLRISSYRPLIFAAANVLFGLLLVIQTLLKSDMVDHSFGFLGTWIGRGVLNFDTEKDSPWMKF
jgi:hypothetical protein